MQHPATIVVGEVVGIHIDDSVIVDGRVDPLRLHRWRGSAISTTA
jgi:flavin reductase (DIM6/NTAB) family NADH-FMN oxidoreductase RutF